MNLPISTIASVAAATKLAQGIAHGISDAMGFHDVLAGGDAAEPTDPIGSLTDAIRARLSSAGMDANQVPPIRISPEGELRIEQQHPRAAEIEAILNGDESIRGLASRLASSGTSGALTIRLAQANIPVSPSRGGSGGYPNW